jgi:hypothetical protein
MTATTFAAMIDREQRLVRKALTFAVFIAPIATALPATLTTGASSLPDSLPVGYVDVGYIDKGDAASWTRDQNVSEVSAVGAFEPVRRDIVSDVSGLKFTALESKRQTFELAYGVDLSTGATPDATTGEVSFPQPTSPSTIYYRMFAVAMDGTGTGAFYMARLMPRVAVTEVAEQSWSDGDPLTYSITVTAFTDSTAGYAVKHFWGGPGWKALNGASGNGFV